ncbi:MAG: RNA-directed DNA polymerase [Anaerolineales bacterium]|nr:RNA-directed DNA polymerase [Anaerolineales bacterium]
MPEAQRYTTFKLAKASGGFRIISVPNHSLKILQQKLNHILQMVYQPKASVHGFLQGKSILTNAERHVKRKYVLNLDIEAFFPSINFGRVRGMFIAAPYNLPENVATVLAQICCYQNQLPQGAPTSPIISNMICSRMDVALKRLAQTYKCTYTRYADDITFSTSKPQFPPQIASIFNKQETSVIVLGTELNHVIESNGFEVNSSKVRLQTKNHRQEVTGVTVNRFPNVKRAYIREIRAMLHSWRENGFTEAEQIFREKYDSKQENRNPNLPIPSFAKVLRGKIEFLGAVRGKNDHIYLRYLNELSSLAPPGTIKLPKSVGKSNIIKLKPTVYVEGKTDKKILSIAWAKLFESRPIPFNIEDSNLSQTDQGGGLGGAEILKQFISVVREDHLHLAIAMFDHDQEGIKCYNSLPKYFDQVSELEAKISRHGKAAAFLLPASDQKSEYIKYENFVIEYLFSDAALAKTTEDAQGLIFQQASIEQRIVGSGKSFRLSSTPSSIPETRTIKEGKVVFAERIVPHLDKSEFTEFRFVFAKIQQIITYMASL